MWRYLGLSIAISQKLIVLKEFCKVENSQMAQRISLERNWIYIIEMRYTGQF
jgi:hypothetical protein